MLTSTQYHSHRRWKVSPAIWLFNLTEYTDLRVLLRHKQTAQYWTGESWAPNLDQALSFPTVLGAFSYRRKRGLSDAEVSLHNETLQAEIALRSLVSKREFLEFELFTSRSSPYRPDAQSVLTEFCEKYLELGRYSITVYEAVRDVQVFIRNGILATPTLILHTGQTRRELVGAFNLVDLFRFTLVGRAQPVRPSSRPSPRAASIF
jgi:hypothetical protein